MFSPSSQVSPGLKLGQTRPWMEEGEGEKGPLLPCCNMAWLHDLFGAAFANDSPEKNESPEPVDLAQEN